MNDPGPAHPRSLGAALDTLGSLENDVLKAAVLKAALDLDLFTVVAGGQHCLGEIAESTLCDMRGMQILLDALCPLGLLAKSRRGYFLTPVSDAFLVRGKPTYCGTWMLKAGLGWEAHGRAAEGIRRGKPTMLDVTGPQADDIWASNFAPDILAWPDLAKEA
ncbi:hypothetical protein FDZ71_12620, partial [bacterium]